MPDWKSEIRRRLAGLPLAPLRENAIVEELSQYLDDCYEELLSGGATESEAYQQALAELNGCEMLQRELRRVERQVAPEPIVLGTHRSTDMITDLWQDLRFGLRMLRMSSGFAAIAVLSLALGIGANTAIFSLINALMLRMLPVKDAHELVIFSITRSNRPSGGGSSFNYPLYEMFRDQNQSFAGIIAGSGVGRARLQVSEPGAVAESVQQQSVSGNYFSVLGVNPILGRALTEADNNPANAQPAAVISYEYWQRRFGGDPNVIGRQVVVDSTSLTIVGVMPPGFFGTEVGSRPELWWPIKAVHDGDWRRNQAWWIHVFGRLRPGVSVTQAQAEMELVFQQQLNEIAAERSANWTPTQRQQHFD